METEELASRSIQTQNKRFYLDVKQNARGRFIKIAEVTPGGHKNRLTLSMPIACEFRNLLCDFIEHYSTLGPSNPDALPVKLPLKTERITRENKRYFLDLKENQRGRFLRVRYVTFNCFYGRPTNPPQIALPAQGMVEFRDALTALIDEFAQDGADAPELPPSHVIGSHRSKMFFLDVGHNQRGVFMRVTEQTRHYRSAVTIPEKFWEEFADFFKTTSDQMEDYYHQIGRERTKDDSPVKREEPDEVTQQ
uniref:Transcriptional activator protein Pur-alpha n=1 Tax=Ciona savignyi TaxID=51511 RepID=H2Z9C9_CIOSA